MNSKKRRLGKGLDALISQSVKPIVNKTSNDADIDESFAQASENNDASMHSSTAVVEDVLTGERIIEVSLQKLSKGRYQPRMKMDEESLQFLADSIRAQGVLQPILVRQQNDMFEILAGHRRVEAAKLAGLVSIPSIIREIPDQAALAVALIENIQREDLNPVEEAKGMHRLIDEFGLTHQQVGEYIGRSRSQVTNLLRLLNLSSQARGFLEDGLLDMGHARALLAVEYNRQDEVAALIIDKKMSVRETEAFIKSMAAEDSVKKIKSANKKDKEIEILERDLSEKLAAHVEIQHGTKKGKMIIHYHNLDELDGILSKIK